MEACTLGTFNHMMVLDKEIAEQPSLKTCLLTVIGVIISVGLV